MEELQLALTSARVDQRNFGLWINSWQIGQTLNALVTNQLPTGELVLRVAGQQITATADIPIQQGARLLLEVNQLQPVPTLRVLNPVASPAAANVGGTLQLLPGNVSGIASPPLVNVVQSLQTSPLINAMPALLGEPVVQLLRQVSRPSQLSQPRSLAAAMRDSGLFLESGLRASMEGKAPMAQADFKGGLFRVLAGVQAAITQAEALALPAADAEALLEMKSELQGALGRITLQQLNSQPSDAQPNRHWQLEIPVQLAASLHSLQIEIEQERGHGSNQDSAAEDNRWKVRLQLAPEALGALELALQLRGDQLSLRIAAARDDVRQFIDAGISGLAQTLESHGIALVTTSTAALVARKKPVDEPESVSAVDVRA